MTENCPIVHPPSTQAKQAKGTGNKYTALEAVVNRAPEKGNKEGEMQLLLEFTNKCSHTHLTGDIRHVLSGSNRMPIDTRLYELEHRLQSSKFAHVANPAIKKQSSAHGAHLSKLVQRLQPGRLAHVAMQLGSRR